MNDWDILGIEKTDDIDSIRKAYALKSKEYHPETHPEEFKRLHTAYKRLVNRIKGRYVQTKVSGNQMLMLSDVSTAEGKKRQREESAEKRKTDEEFLARIEKQTEAKRIRLYSYMQLDEFDEMLDNQYYPEEWREYFLRPEFLEKQYNIEYINAMAELIENKLREPTVRRPEGGGRIPQYALIYLVIVYGCFFEKFGAGSDAIVVNENIYNGDMLENLKKAFMMYDGRFSSYKITEQMEHLLSERFAFYVYRNILEILESENPNRRLLRLWLIEGFARENTTHLLELTHYNHPQGKFYVRWKEKRMFDRIKRSPIIFELMAFLLSREGENMELFKEVLREVCITTEAEETSIEDKKILMLMLEDNN